MSKIKFITIVTTIGVFFTALIAIQPTKIEARNSPNPLATPSPRKNKIASRRTKPKGAGYMAGGTWVSGDATGLRKRNSKSKRKPRPKPIIILDQDGETEVARNKRKTSTRKKPKNTHNLLPFIEQPNIYRKRKRNK